ncbi:MAG: glycosyltransferase N-terminal domain-containing protein [Candidatus Eisenbacteria bacterium]
MKPVAGLFWTGGEASGVSTMLLRQQHGLGPDSEDRVEIEIAQSHCETRAAIAPSSRLHRFYDLIWAAALPVLALAPRNDGERAERLGGLPGADGTPSIWFHAASMGEARSLEPILERVRAALPSACITVTLCASIEEVRARWRRLLPHARVRIAAAPYDAPAAIDRAWERLRPDLLVVAECELWPNLFHRSTARGTRLLMINARIYRRDAASYRRLRPHLAPALRRAEWVGAASQEDAARLRAAGLPGAAIHVIGSSKFDLIPPRAEEIDPALRAVLERGTWIALASTHPGEEALFWPALRQLLDSAKDLRVLLAPRHPDRAPRLLAEARHAGIAPALRSSLGRAGSGEVASGDSSGARLLLLDSLGELPSLFPYMRATILGGSFVRAGGHNPIEPVTAGSPAILGPHHENFEPVVRALADSDVLSVTADAGEAARVARRYLEADANRSAIAARAEAVLAPHRGAADRYTHAILSALRRCAAGV